MKAIILKKNCGTEGLLYRDDFPIPEIKPDEALVKVAATSVNRVDILIRNGYPGLSLNFPHIIGGDITGVIEKTGSEVKTFKTGDRIISWPIVCEADDEWTRRGRASLSSSWQYFGMHRKGSYAEYVAVPESSLLHLPDNVSFESAACLPIAGTTAYHALCEVGKLQKGESFFIWGGTSGLGVIAIQIAQCLGAKVFATAGTPEKMAKLKKMGVEHIYNHYEDKSISSKVIEMTGGKGVDMVLDYIGPATYIQSFNMLKRGARLLWCGIMTGKETTVSIHQTYLKHVSLLGLYLGEKNELESLINLCAEGKVKPVISEVLNLRDAARGHKLIEEKKVIGKVILIP